jgi:hypothetical protein
MNKWVGCVAAVTALGLTTPAMAEDSNLKLEGSLRVRAEAIDGQYRAGLPDDDTALLTRLDLFGEYKAGPIRIGAEILDSRVYFERRHGSISSSEVNALEPIQAYIIGDIAPGTTIQAGRFTMDLGSRRLIARPINRNDFNSFTGVRLDWKSRGGDKITGFWTMPQTRLPEGLDDIRDNRFVLDQERVERQIFGASGTKAGVLGGTAELYSYRFVEYDAPGFATRDRRLLTSGVRFARAAKAGALDYDLEAAWQTGTTRLSLAATDLTDHKVSAWMLHGGLGWSFAGGWSPRLSLAGDYMTGDGPGATYRRFDGLIGDPSYELTPSGLYSLLIRSNLASVALRAEVKPTKRIDAYLAVRPIWLASATDSFGNSGVRDASGAAGHYVGTHIDGRVRYWLVPERLQLGAGFATLFKGRFLKAAPNAPATGDTHVGFMDVTVSF